MLIIMLALLTCELNKLNPGDTTLSLLNSCFAAGHHTSQGEERGEKKKKEKSKEVSF